MKRICQNNENYFILLIAKSYPEKVFHKISSFDTRPNFENREQMELKDEAFHYNYMISHKIFKMQKTKGVQTARYNRSIKSFVAYNINIQPFIKFISKIFLLFKINMYIF